ncbi:MAG: hypothetical protein P8R54_22990 [Myxococcota bacterium]|nr:hypothetical protein [Myxococcota bacterium]
MLDALDLLISNYKGRKAFVDEFVHSTIFFSRKMVGDRNSEIHNLIVGGHKLPVRWSPPRHRPIVGEKKSQAQGKAFTRANDIFQKISPGSLTKPIKIKIDGNGNAGPSSTINKHTNFWVSNGKKSHLRNYIISHVWDKDPVTKDEKGSITLASHPLFFTSLWNIVLVPAHFNFVMDKGSDRHPVVTIIKQRIKDLCINFYDPYHSFLKRYDDQQAFKCLFELNKKPKPANILFLKAMSKADIKKLNQNLSAEDEGKLEKRLRQIGKQFFIGNFDSIRDNDSINYDDLSVDYPKLTETSIRKRISKMRPIFRDGHELTAIKRCIQSPGVDKDALRKAGAILKTYFCER